MKKGLIIQGPLISVGRSGKTASIPFHLVTEQDIVAYNCLDNIKRLFIENANFFDYIVCVTWIDQDKELIDKLISNCGVDNVLLIKDNTQSISARGKIISGNNQYRQFLSMYEGASYLKKQGCEIVAKVRTDQFVDCSKIVRSYIANANNDPKAYDVINVPWKNCQTPYSITAIPDFYFISSTEKMIDFSLNYINSPTIFEDVHTDILYKTLIHSFHLSKIYMYYFRFAGQFGNLFFTRKYIERAWVEIFHPLDKTILNGLYWRGEELNQLKIECMNCSKLPYIGLGKSLEIIIKAKLINKIRGRAANVVK